jgi:GNAT superfamily N-acetyltransferase
MLNTCEPDAWGNFAFNLSADELANIAAHFGKGEYPAMLAEFGSRDLVREQLMEPHGFVHAGAMPAMEVDLSMISKPALADGYSFARIRSEEDPLPWANTLAESYPIAPLAAHSLSPVHTHVSDDSDASVQYFAVRSGEEIVGVSILVLADELAGIYGVATRPEHRRKGIGAVVTSYPLHLARDLGYTKGVLQASQDGYGVYEKLGFATVDEVQVYLRLPEGATPH